jgi:glycosyltransferase involved in cell wall biosynthesis
MMTTRQPLSVLHTVGSIAEAAGGPSRTVTHLCSELAARGCRVQLVAGRDEGGESAWVQPSPAVQVVSVPAARRFGIRHYPGFTDAVATALAQGQARLVHDHGIWGPTNLASFRAAQRMGLPYVLSPRGMLEPWALRYKAGKKRLAWLAYQRRIVHGAAALVATAAQECQNIKALVPHLPVAVIPNGVAWPAEPVCHGQRAQRALLYLSRVHPKKNVLGLIRAWQRTCALPGRSDWSLCIAGPDELGHTAEAQALVASLGLAERVRFIGSVSEADKPAVFGGTDLFVLPSFSENFGVAVAEALAYGIPAIATTGCPWQGLQQHRCGWWVGPDDDSLAHALAEATAAPAEVLREMGLRGRDYAAATFAWPGIASMMTQFYEWLLGQRHEAPSFVDV